jgi:hypothetical protein
MPKYNVTITRGITESTTVQVEAPYADAAENAAFDKLHAQDWTDWEVDDGSWNNGDEYVTDISEVAQ